MKEQNIDINIQHYQNSKNTKIFGYFQNIIFFFKLSFALQTKINVFAL